MATEAAWLNGKTEEVFGKSSKNYWQVVSLRSYELREPMRVSGPARDPEDWRQLAEVPALFGADHNANGWHRIHDSEAPVVSSMRTPRNDATLTLNQAVGSNA